MLNRESNGGIVIIIFTKTANMRYLHAIMFFLGLAATYYCMSLWGMGISNPVKYYLYGIVIIFSFGLMRELQRRIKMHHRDNFTGNILFLVTGTLILVCFTIALFSQYEMSVFKHWIHHELQRNPGLHIKS
jgi:hypothetical protein